MADNPETNEDMGSYKKAIDSTTQAQQDFLKKFSNLQVDAMQNFFSRKSFENQNYLYSVRSRSSTS